MVTGAHFYHIFFITCFCFCDEIHMPMAYARTNTCYGVMQPWDYALQYCCTVVAKPDVPYYCVSAVYIPNDLREISTITIISISNSI